MGFKKGSNYPFVSKGQYELFLATKKIFPDALLNQPIVTSSKNVYYPDILVPSIKTIVEYDGRYFHGDKRVSKDKIRDFNLQADGWKVIHVRDNEAGSFDPQVIWTDPDVDYIQQHLT
ncbi:MAG: DUF559 domain-containing protein [Nitrososphaerales archaeon]